MSLFVSEIITPPAHLPVTVAAADQSLAAAVVEEIERAYLWRAIVSQARRVLIDGPLPPRIEIEPVTSLTITRWTPTDAASVIDTNNYSVVTRDPAGTLIESVPWENWPAPERSIGSFALTYTAGWVVSPESTPGAGDAVNHVPPSVRLMIERAIRFRAGSGVADLTIGSLKINVAKSYRTDRIPPEILSLGRSFEYRPGIISARP